MKALKVNGAWVQAPSEVRRVVVEYFRNQVGTDGRVRPRLDGVPVNQLSGEQNV